MESHTLNVHTTLYIYFPPTMKHKDFLGASDGKESAHNFGDLRSLGQEDSLEKGMATHSSILQFSSVAQLCPTLCTLMDCSMQASLSITNPQSLLKLMSIESVMPSNHLILCRPLLLLPLNFSSMRVFSNESLLGIRWPKYWSFSFSISPSNEYSGLMFFRVNWLDLLMVQGTLRVFSDTTVQKHQFCAQLSS